ncbi:hypothetical protein BJX64DRAFT_201172 [Aspergillus heterothallicus]
MIEPPKVGIILSYLHNAYSLEHTYVAIKYAGYGFTVLVWACIYLLAIAGEMRGFSESEMVHTASICGINSASKEMI